MTTTNKAHENYLTNTSGSNLDLEKLKMIDFSERKNRNTKNEHTSKKICVFFSLQY